MGVITRGICQCCDRTSTLVAPANVWCQLCTDDPQRRNLMDDRRIARAFVWACAIFLVAMFCAVKYLFVVNHGWYWQ